MIPPILPSSNQIRSCWRARAKISGSVQPIVAGASSRPLCVVGSGLAGNQLAGECDGVPFVQEEGFVPRRQVTDFDAIAQPPGGSLDVARTGPPKAYARRDIGRLARLCPAAVADGRHDRQAAQLTARVGERDSVAEPQFRQPAAADRKRGIGVRGGGSGWSSGMSQIRAGAVTRP